MSPVAAPVGRAAAKTVRPKSNLLPKSVKQCTEFVQISNIHTQRLALWVDSASHSTVGNLMNTNNKTDKDSALMKVVQAIAISPEDARAVVQQYEDQLFSQQPSISAQQVQELVVKKIIDRYAKMAAATGGATALAGVVPGIGTAVAMVGGSAADVSACIKLQIDMTMCLAMAINKGLSNEDAKHLSFMIALLALWSRQHRPGLPGSRLRPA